MVFHLPSPKWFISIQGHRNNNRKTALFGDICLDTTNPVQHYPQMTALAALGYWRQ
jgi:hypothetical protein